MKLRYRKKRVCLLETAAYIMNEREDIDVSGELGMAFFSVWNLLSPMKWHFSLGNADICDIRAESEEIFTAHAHPGEPLVPSAEDIHISEAANKRGKASFHFITDRFRCKRYL